MAFVSLPEDKGFNPVGIAEGDHPLPGNIGDNGIAAFGFFVNFFDCRKNIYRR